MIADALQQHLPELHTTDLGAQRIRRNLALGPVDVVDWCRQKLAAPAAHSERRGKNWYIRVAGCLITVNASSYTIITAHKVLPDDCEP